MALFVLFLTLFQLSEVTTMVEILLSLWGSLIAAGEKYPYGIKRFIATKCPFLLKLSEVQFFSLLTAIANNYTSSFLPWFIFKILGFSRHLSVHCISVLEINRNTTNSAPSKHNCTPLGLFSLYFCSYLFSFLFFALFMKIIKGNVSG